MVFCISLRIRPTRSLPEPVQRGVNLTLGEVLLVYGQFAVFGLRRVACCVDTGAASKDDEVTQRIRPQAVRAVERGTGRFTCCVKPRHNRIVTVKDDLGINRRRDAAHRVVRSRLHRDGFVQGVHAQVNAGELGDIREARLDDVIVNVGEVEVDVIRVRAGAAPLAHL